MEHLKEYKEYLTEQFYKWFGNSKMVDKKGNPMICYHGTNNKFDSFRTDVGHANDEGFYGKGIYFTFGYGKASKGEAGYYGRSVMEVYLKVENPFDFSKLKEYKGESINVMGLNSMVFLLNLNEMFPELGNVITIDKVNWNENHTEGDVVDLPISELPKLVNKYLKDLVIIDIEDDFHGKKLKSGYVKSEKVSWTNDKGEVHEYNDIDYLEKWLYNTPKHELEIGLVMEAIKKYEGVEAKFHPEGYMTRYVEITEAIKKKGHDGIVQSMDGDEVVIFEPTQIKSATNNNGNFNPNSDNINEDRNQLEIPFDGKHPLYGKPEHVHVLDALVEMDKKNDKNEDDIYSDWTSSDMNNVWYKTSTQEDAFDMYREFTYGEETPEAFSLFISTYKPFDYPEYYTDEVNNYIEAEEIDNYQDLHYKFDLETELDSYLTPRGEDLLRNKIYREVFDNKQDEYYPLYALEQNINDDGLVPLYRAVSYSNSNIKGDEKSDAYKQVMDFNGVGIFWSFEFDGAIPHGGGGQQTLILSALVRPDDINWVSTVYKSAWSLNDEKEIELYEDRDIIIVEICEDSRDNKQMKLPKNFVVKT